MQNVTLSEDQVQEQRQKEMTEQAAEPTQVNKKLFANLIQNQAPEDFSEPVQKEEPKAEEKAETPNETGETKEATAEEPDEAKGEKETKDESLAQEGGEDEDKTEPEPLLPENISKRLSEEFPDVEIDSPEKAQELVDKLIADSKNLDAEREANSKVYELFENNPEFLDLAKEMKSGRPFLEALARTVNIEEALSDLKDDDPEQYKKIVRAQVEREKAIEEQKKAQEDLEAQFQKNEQVSQQNIESFKQKEKLDPDASKQFLGTVNQHFDDLVSGKVTEDFLSTMHRGLNYETAVEAAKEQGRIEGRNEKIEAEKTKKKGDNLPQVPKGKSKSTDTGKTYSRGKRALAMLARDSQSSF